MITHLLTRIDLSMHSLSKGQKRIALYIEEHYDKAAFMTASKLGETVGVSERTGCKICHRALAMTATQSCRKPCRK